MMSDRMRPVSFKGLLEWIIGEYCSQKTIFGIPESHFFKKEKQISVCIFDEKCDMPLGPAAGPHTQLTQNIISAYLVGGRFFELKTVQKLDKLEFEKPCIDAGDEGYNTEWSTELSLEQAYDEYVKAWIIMHFLESCFQDDYNGKQSFIFNMSIGYDLDGIKTPRMDFFINHLIDASGHPAFHQYLEELKSFISRMDFPVGIYDRNKSGNYKDISLDIPSRIARSVTLSTMHGCPPEEQESICRYLLKEKELNTYVKLNPTLLGFKMVRKILDNLGYQYVKLKESTFEKDLQWQDAIDMLKKLAKLARDCGKKFGIKLSNTLPTVNSLGNLPGEEMYMSGRVLFPITIQLAARLSQAFEGYLPISFSGGASQLNIARIFKTGIYPITLATELLKPGGYLRMSAMVQTLEEILLKEDRRRCIDVKELNRLAKESLKEDFYHKDWRGLKKVILDKELTITDCYVAPCVNSCPIFQDIPEYIRLTAHKQYDDALELIYKKNPLPNITGHICDHQCMYNCTRLDYEGAVNIREIKRIAAEYGNKEKLLNGKIKAKPKNIKIAVIGAGPAGLSAAYFLVKEGFEVTVFEKQDSPGGLISSVLPHFRIPASAVEQDISFIKNLGVRFQFGVTEKMSIQDLKNREYKYIFIGIGAENSRNLTLSGNNKHVYEALHFLRTFNVNPKTIHLGKRVAVIGGGNTAIDSARSALKITGVEKVVIVYRRTKEEMPADEEEFALALKEGIIFKSLLLPESFSETGILMCRKMTLGDFDASGRRQPIPTDKLEEIKVDSIISAIGEKVNMEILQSFGLKIDKESKLKINTETFETDEKNVFIGGDALHGPSTVVKAIADARKAATAIIQKEISGWQEETINIDFNPEEQKKDIFSKKSRIVFPIIAPDDKLVAKNEGERCLECNFICNKCVDVCPNRANIAIPVDKRVGFQDSWQVLHLDALCNECGNCATFCPYNGKPYRDKLTLFATIEDFQSSTNQGFLILGTPDNPLVHLRLNDKLCKLKFSKENGLMPKDFQNSIQDDAIELTKIKSMIEIVISNYSYIFKYSI